MFIYYTLLFIAIALTVMTLAFDHIEIHGKLVEGLFQKVLIIVLWMIIFVLIQRCGSLGLSFY
jgi:hypothetical protein